MELTKGQVAVVTGAASGIGFALAERFARAGLDIVLADVQEEAAAKAAEAIGVHGVATLAVRCDVSKEAQVQELAQSTIDRFGAVHVVCNNAGVASKADPWFGPISAWEWVMGVNFWGVVHGCRTFLPHLVTGGGGHIVNTASIAGLYPGFSPNYDASKHAVVAITESLYNMTKLMGLPVGVSVLCPGWVRTGITDSDRNWPADLGEAPAGPPGYEVQEKYFRKAIEEGATPAYIADSVFDAVAAGRYWVIPQQDFLDMTVERWHSIAERADPQPPEDMPGMPPRSQMMAEVMAALGLAPPT